MPESVVSVPVRLFAPLFAAAVLSLAATGHAQATAATPQPPSTDQIQAALSHVVDLQLLQPTCGEPGALTAAAVRALDTLGVEAKTTGLRKVDLGPLGWIGIGEQLPGHAVALDVHLLPQGPVPVNVTLGDKPCPAHPTSRALPATSAPAAPTTAPAPATGRAVPAPASLAHTGSDTPTWPYLAGGVGLFAVGAAAAATAARRRRAS
ncbi:hypothetical protein [Yinghuangia seranimata]|uniref:hypothetical protein n=1 Tax=Yinghuangia seranimata TaxID=408067 RepID=UPI00248B742F|nr:hypothetical protein [Yinghuangia seranimata]MDI2131724.1 hypothetical protein [Yinghuangia seranimata]